MHSPLTRRLHRCLRSCPRQAAARDLPRPPRPLGVSARRSAEPHRKPFVDPENAHFSATEIAAGARCERGMCCTGGALAALRDSGRKINKKSKCGQLHVGLGNLKSMDFRGALPVRFARCFRQTHAAFLGWEVFILQSGTSGARFAKKGAVFSQQHMSDFPREMRNKRSEKT